MDAMVISSRSGCYSGCRAFFTIRRSLSSPAHKKNSFSKELKTRMFGQHSNPISSSMYEAAVTGPIVYEV